MSTARPAAVTASPLARALAPQSPGSLAGPLARAIERESALWLEAASPDIYDALTQELSVGASLSDIDRILRRAFGDDQRDAFALRVRQAARHLSRNGN
jgi:hypothetical protein